MAHVTEVIRALGLVGVVVTLAGSAACVTEPSRSAAPPPRPETRVFVYPLHGQSAERQDRDRYECHNWAVQQTGFDPSAPTVPPHLHVVVSSGPPPGAGIATGAVAGAVIGAAVSRPWEAGQGRAASTRLSLAAESLKRRSPRNGTITSEPTRSACKDGATPCDEGRPS
jgi:hypothetical protein